MLLLVSLRGQQIAEADAAPVLPTPVEVRGPEGAPIAGARVHVVQGAFPDRSPLLVSRHWSVGCGDDGSAALSLLPQRYYSVWATADDPRGRLASRWIEGVVPQTPIVLQLEAAREGVCRVTGLGPWRAASSDLELAFAPRGRISYTFRTRVDADTMVFRLPPLPQEKLFAILYDGERPLDWEPLPVPPASWAVAPPVPVDLAEWREAAPRARVFLELGARLMNVVVELRDPREFRIGRRPSLLDGGMRVHASGSGALPPPARLHLDPGATIVRAASTGRPLRPWTLQLREGPDRPAIGERVFIGLGTGLVPRSTGSDGTCGLFGPASAVYRIEAGRAVPLLPSASPTGAGPTRILDLGRRVPVTVRATRPDGSPVAGLQFRLSSGATWCGPTQADGTARMRLMPGRYSFSADDPVRRSRLLVAEGDVQAREVRLIVSRTIEVRGRVLDRRGQPAVGVRVSLEGHVGGRGGSDRQAEVTYVRTGPRGEFRLRAPDHVRQMRVRARRQVADRIQEAVLPCSAESPVVLVVR